jgi:hypothetical protein
VKPFCVRQAITSVKALFRDPYTQRWFQAAQDVELANTPRREDAGGAVPGVPSAALSTLEPCVPFSMHDFPGGKRDERYATVGEPHATPLSGKVSSC